MEIRVPHLAEGVESGTVVSILVKEGDKVSKDQGLIELETNKAVANVPSAIEGVVSKIHVSEGALVNVGQLLVSISEGGSSSASASSKSSAPVQKQTYAAPVQSAAAAPVQSSQPYQYQSAAGAPPPASPSLRRMARDLGIDLTRVRGTESGGRITLADVRDYVQHLQQAALNPQVPAAGAPGSIQKTSAAASPSIDFSKWGPVSKKPMTQLRKTISQAMVNSWTTIPHVTQFDDIDLSAVTELRKKHEKAYNAAGARLTVTAFVLKAIAKTLEKHPIFNSSIDENTHEIITKEYIHIGIAVDTEHGLMVPVMRDVNKKSLLEISTELSELAVKTRERKLAIEDMKGGTFTLSNQGGIGGKHFTPIINKPEVAILGTGRGYKQGSVTVMPIGLSYDHRLIDGGSAARFVVDFAEIMNSFTESEIALGSAKSVSKKSAKKGKK